VAKQTPSSLLALHGYSPNSPYTFYTAIHPHLLLLLLFVAKQIPASLHDPIPYIYTLYTVKILANRYSLQTGR